MKGHNISHKHLLYQYTRVFSLSRFLLCPQDFIYPFHFKNSITDYFFERLCPTFILFKLFYLTEKHNTAKIRIYFKNKIFKTVNVTRVCMHMCARNIPLSHSELHTLSEDHWIWKCYHVSNKHNANIPHCLPQP